MPSKRMQRQIDRLQNEAEEAIASQDWPAVGDPRQVRAIDC